MFIRNSYNFNFAYRNQRLHASKLLVAVQRLSSGYRINSAKDDPAGLAISQRMRAQLSQMHVAIQNTKNELDKVAVAEGALGGVSNMVRQLQELATQAASGSMTDDERQALQQEAEALIEEIKRTSNATRFNGESLFKDDEAQPKPDGNMGMDASSLEKAMIDIPQMNQLTNMLDEFDIGTQEMAQKSLALAGKAVDTVAGMRASLGAKATQLEKSISAQEEAEGNLTEAESRIRDADMAKEMMTFAKEKMLAEVAELMMAHAMQEPQRVLVLLKAGM